MTTIGVAGHICVDLQPDVTHPLTLTPGALLEVGPLAITLGGSVANTGLALAELGAVVRMSASVGADALGDLVRAELSDRQIESDLDVDDHRGTSYSIVAQQPGSDRSFWHYVGANAGFDGRAVRLDDLDLLHVGYPSLLPALTTDDGEALIELFTRAKEAGIVTSLDLAVVDDQTPAGSLDWELLLRGWAPVTDVLTPSLDDLRSALGVTAPYSTSLVDEMVDRLLRWGFGVVGVSDGEHGLAVGAGSPERFGRGGRLLAELGRTWSDQRARVPASADAAVLATTGAGDVATAGFLVALSSRHTLPQAAVDAVRAATRHLARLSLGPDASAPD